jgi:endonuclease YncB( thermonuclease family)
MKCTINFFKCFHYFNFFKNTENINTIIINQQPNNLNLSIKTETLIPALEPISWKETTPFVPPIDKGQVIKVYDGDTITIASKLPYPESPLYRFPVRLLGIDSPEIKGKTTEEKNAAKISQKSLENMILQKMVYLKNVGTEKYGRILADVYVDDPENPGSQIHLNNWMLENKYAIPYFGKTKEEFKKDNYE